MARTDQIEQLTRRGQLPLAAPRSQHLSLISEVLSIAWHELLRTHRASLLTASEPEVNALMEARLNHMRDECPMWAQLVQSVTRGKESLSFDGSSPEKRPDLNIHLTSRSALFPVIIECKMIDAKPQQSERRYCVEGLAKFVNGEYAWATREAFMLAYVRDGSSIAARLIPYLIASESERPSRFLIEQLPVRINLLALDLARSIHRRAFRYPTRAPQNDNPGPIAVWHLWLPAC